MQHGGVVGAAYVCYSSVGYAATDVNQVGLRHVPHSTSEGVCQTPDGSSTADPLQRFINTPTPRQAATVSTYSDSLSM